MHATCVRGVRSCQDMGGGGELCPPAVREHKSFCLIAAWRDAPLSAGPTQPHKNLLAPSALPSRPPLPRLPPAGGHQLTASAAVPASSCMLGTGLSTFGCPLPPSQPQFPFSGRRRLQHGHGSTVGPGHPPLWGIQDNRGSHQGPNSFSPFNTKEAQLIFGRGHQEPPTPKQRNTSPILALSTQGCRCGAQKPWLPARPQDGRWLEERRRRRQRGRCRGKLLISSGTLSSHYCERELDIF